jgi:hypothetical protein
LPEVVFTVCDLGVRKGPVAAWRNAAHPWECKRNRYHGHPDGERMGLSRHCNRAHRLAT